MKRHRRMARQPSRNASQTHDDKAAQTAPTAIQERSEAKQPNKTDIVLAQLKLEGGATLDDLSFAHFEREVTGARIRDKIAASKKKGMWMGGPVPLGYEARDRKLIVNESEAEQVRHFTRR
ncbi:hypothetical protein ACWPMX_11425 [Tsuneonella sp. HG094]